MDGVDKIQTAYWILDQILTWREISDDYVAVAWWSKNMEEIGECCMFIYKRFSKKEAFPSLLKLGRAADTLDLYVQRDRETITNADTLDPK